MSFKNYANYFANMLWTVLLSFSLVFTLITSMNYPFSPTLVLLINTAFMFAFFLMFVNKTAVKISFFALTSLVIGITIYIFSNSLTSKFSNEVKLFINWVNDYLMYIKPIDENYALVFTLLLSFIMSLFVYIFTIKRLSFILLLTLGSGIFVSQWILNFFISYLSFYLFTFSLILYYFNHVYHKNSKKHHTEYSSMSVYSLAVIPVCALIVVIGFKLPAKNTPIEWEWLDTKINTAYNYLHNKFKSQDSEYFSFASTGFGQDNGRLGGKVSLDKTPVLEVQSPRVLYLKGAVKDMYTGSSWVNTTSDSTLLNFQNNRNFARSASNSIHNDFLEWMIGNQILSLVNLNDIASFEEYNNGQFYYRDTIEVKYLNLKTKTLFYPVKTFNFNLPSSLKDTIYTDSNSNIYSDELLNEDFEYSLEVYTPKLGEEALIDLLKESKNGLYDDYFIQIPSIISQVEKLLYDGRKLPSNEMRNLEREFRTYLLELKKYSLADYEKYLQLPDSLPDRVIQLAEEVTKNETNDFDKAKAIESFLSTNFPYTLSPKRTPWSKDFVDYFLFDLKEGYCTYYATSMAVLCRSIGIPSRYVEGYVLPSQAEEDGVYKVTNEQAHAWVEIYFEGFGWIPFEPTAPFRSALYGESQFTGSYSQNFYNNPSMEEYLSSLESYYDKDYEDFEIDIESTPVTASPHSNKPFSVFSLSSILLLSILLVIIIINAIRSGSIYKKFNRQNSKSSVLSAYKYYVKILSLQSLALKPGETPHTYSQRVDLIMLFNSTTFTKITQIFVKARYSINEITPAEAITVQKFYNIILPQTKKNIGKLKFTFYRYILGKI